MKIFNILPKTSLIGAHTSTSPNLQNALIEGEKIGASTIQLFTSNQRQWKRRILTSEIISEFKETRKKTKLDFLMSHASFLINPGSPNQEVLQKSRNSIIEEIKSCLSLEISYINFHPGAALTGSKESCLNRIIESFLLTQNLFPDDRTKILLETTAGQGSLIGGFFEELGYLVGALKDFIPIGICLDTCHVFSAGYDIRSLEGLETTLKKFDELIGLPFLYAIHLNDSIFSLGSKKDRHANLGEGELGWECFKNIISHPLLKLIPKYLETPGGINTWSKEIDIIKKLSSSTII